MKKIITSINLLLFGLVIYLLLYGVGEPEVLNRIILIVLSAGAAINALLLAWQFYTGHEVEDIAIIYVYGFTDTTGQSNSMRLHEFTDQYVRNLADFNKEVVITLDDYVWDSSEVTLFGRRLSGRWKLLKYTESKAHWAMAKDTARREGRKLYLSKIKKFEKRRVPYYIIGYSLGTKVVLEALSQCKGELKMLRKVIFLGSALPVDSTLEGNALGKDNRILNYHSTKDLTLGKFYRTTEEADAGGHTGFNDHRVFMNLETSLDHSDYHELIHPICNLILYWEGAINLMGQYQRNQPVEVDDSNWNTLYVFSAHKSGNPPLAIQYRDGRYRAMRTNGQSVFLAEGDNLHLLLKNLMG